MFLQWRNKEDYAKNASIIVLAMAGLTIIMIDHQSKSRQKRLAAALTQGFWKFTPKQVSDVKQKKLNWMKLFLGGLMIACTVLTITVRYLKVVRAVSVSAIILVGWATFLSYSLVEIEDSSSSRKKKDVSPEEEITGWKSKLRESSELTDRRLPVTIVTGFLGSGKTTLVKRVLDNTVGIKVLVIENEIGAEGIDHELLLQHTDKEEIILMNNGCICCTVRNDLIKTFHTIFADDSFAKLDWILIETTGLADPGPLIQTLYMDSKCSTYLRLDSVLTVVDAKHLPLHLNIEKSEENNENNQEVFTNKNIKLENIGKDHNIFKNDMKINNKKIASSKIGVHGGAPEAIKQITFSDRIFLNKIDLVSEEDLTNIQIAIRTYNPSAQIICCKYSNVPVEDILNIRAFDPSRNIALISETDTISTESKSSNDKNNNNYDNDNDDNNNDHNNNHHNYDINNDNNNDNNNNDNDKDKDKNEDPYGKNSERNDNNQSDKSDKNPINVSKTGFIQYDKNGKILPSNIRIKRDVSETTGNIDPDAVSTVSLVTYKPLDLDLFNLWVSSLLRIHGGNIYRLKGILNMSGYDHQFVVQGVHMIFDGQIGPKWNDTKPSENHEKNQKNLDNVYVEKTGISGHFESREAIIRRSRLVLIGVGLNSNVLRAGFFSCEYQDDEREN